MSKHKAKVRYYIRGHKDGVVREVFHVPEYADMPNGERVRKPKSLVTGPHGGRYARVRIGDPAAPIQVVALERIIADDGA